MNNILKISSLGIILSLAFVVLFTPVSYSQTDSGFTGGSSGSEILKDSSSDFRKLNQQNNPFPSKDGDIIIENTSSAAKENSAPIKVKEEAGKVEEESKSELIKEDSYILDEIIYLFLSLNFILMLFIAIGVYVFGMIWYWLFSKKIMYLQGKNSDDCSMNKTAMFFQFIETLILSYLVVLIVSLVDSVAVSLLIIDGLIGFTLFGMLAGTMYSMNNNNKAFKLWLIHAFYYLIIISAIFVIAYIFV